MINKNKLSFKFCSLIGLVLVIFLFNNNINTVSAESISNTGADYLTINLEQGWNYVSTNVIPESTNISEVFAEIEPYLEEVKTGIAGSNPLEYNSIYDTDTNIWDRINFDYKQGYKIKVNEDVDLTFSGQKVNGENFNNVLILQPGYNFVSYLGKEARSVNNVLAEYGEAIESVRSRDAYSMFVNDQFYGPLTIMEPGEAYIIELSDDYNSLNLVYPVDDSLTINLEQGWNYISTNVIPESTNISEVFAEIEPYLEEVKIGIAGSNPLEYNSIYNSSNNQWLETNFDYKRGYKVRVSQDIDLIFYGEKVIGKNSDNEIMLQPGYNFVSYLAEESMLINDVFAEYGEAIESVRSRDAYSMFVNDQFYGPLTVMEPGEAYIIELSDDYNSLNLVYPFEDDFIALTEVNLEVFPENNQQFAYYPFRFDVYTNEGINELLDVSIQLDTNNCQLIGTNSRGNGARNNYPSHINLYSQTPENPLIISFVCYEAGEYNFDFTIMGHESGNSFSEAVTMSILPMGPIRRTYNTSQKKNNSISSSKTVDTKDSKDSEKNQNTEEQSINQETQKKQKEESILKEQEPVSKIEK